MIFIYEVVSCQSLPPPFLFFPFNFLLLLHIRLLMHKYMFCVIVEICAIGYIKYSLHKESCCTAQDFSESVPMAHHCQRDIHHILSTGATAASTAMGQKLGTGRDPIKQYPSPTPTLYPSHQINISKDSRAQQSRNMQSWEAGRQSITSAPGSELPDVDKPFLKSAEASSGLYGPQKPSRSV